MKNEKTDHEYYLGIDAGTDSVGYAVTDRKYELLKLHGRKAWGTTIFDEASLNSERRGFRSARRRLDRRQQRVILTQELFAKAVSAVDPAFYIRLRDSWKYGEDSDGTLFSGKDFTDRKYYAQYPTIHHLIVDLMNNTEPHDARLVYLACAWLVAHRGHFLSNVSLENIAQLKDLTGAYADFAGFFINNGYDIPWSKPDVNALGNILKAKRNITTKNKLLAELLFDGKKVPKETNESHPFNRACLIKLLAGGKCSLKDLFANEEYEDIEPKSVSFDMDDEKFDELEGALGDDYTLFSVMRPIYDWALLNDILGDYSTISEAKCEIYEQHRKDLLFLKQLIKKHCPEKYNAVFREVGKKVKNYPAYVKHSDEVGASEMGSVKKDVFCKFILDIVKTIEPDERERAGYEDMVTRLELRTFLPKQKDPDNRVIPHQLYQFELQKILSNAEKYLPFLKEKDADGLTVSEKIVSIFLFRVPYYVGPLNAYSAPLTKESRRPWIVKREEGKILPWNFEQMVDLDASEEAFIRKMTNQCTYIPGEPVLPKDSLAYHQFTVLNEINNIRINGERISVELKQRIYNEVFLQKKKVTRKRLVDFLVANNYVEKGREDSVSGIDITIKSDLAPQIAFRKLLHSGTLSEADAERIIERAAYAEDKSRLSKWLGEYYPQLSVEDRKYICSIKIKDFGRLSRYFLCDLMGTDKGTGEVFSILGGLWNTQCNLMELLSDKYTFMDAVEKLREEYFAGNSASLDDRLDEMRVSNAVRRCIYRTLAVTKDIEKAFGSPAKIFIETARGALPEQKNRRTQSRKEQILSLYEKCKEEDVRLLREQLNEMGAYADNRLQGDKLFLYFMQMGKCLYTGNAIDITRLGSGDYNIEHIYPRAYIKDDSVINNEILVDSKANGQKSDEYPVGAEIQEKMAGYWAYLKSVGLLSEEKFRRLTRTSGFTPQEKQDFISRQLTETSQSAKAIAEIMKLKYPDAEIVYCKASLVSEFRQEFKIWKSRAFNDLHHAVDAYLNIVTGNVYSMRFTKRWFDPDSRYSIKTKTLFTHPVVCGGETVWDEAEMLPRVIQTALKQDAHFTKFAFIKKGGFFDQMPVPAAPGLVPLKKGRPTEIYGGYNKPGVAFFVPVRYRIKKKTDTLITSVEVLFSEKVMADPQFAKDYLKQRVEAILGKAVEEVEFPLGLRPWKVNTMLLLDGFRVCIAGSAGGGRCLIMQPVMQFIADTQWCYYLKKVESFVDKINKNEKYIYDEFFDEVSTAKNKELYMLYCEKLETSIYAKRVNNPKDILKNGREAFEALDIKDQCRAILAIHQIFGRISSGCDLHLIGGAARAGATVNFSTTVSNWRKNYKEVRIIDCSPSGLWERRSENLLTVL